jgi:TonB family protein
MQLSSPHTPMLDIYSLDEIAEAAGVPVRDVESLVAAGQLATVGHPEGGGRQSFVTSSHAIAAVRALKGRHTVHAETRWHEQPLFAPAAGARRSTGFPLMMSTLVHAGVVLGAIVLTTVLTPASVNRVDLVAHTTPMRLIYIATPGPGGGGGGGGMKQRTPPPKAERKGVARLSSPLPPRKEPDPIVAVQKPEPKPEILKAEPLPAVVAPVVTAPADTRDRAGVLEQTTAKDDSRGPGAGGGVGSGTGTGLGEGDGSGIGPGSGGGTGGGPYRAGSGISAPRLLREVKPDYTEDARQRGVEGEVVMEIVVRRDGSVGDVRLVSGLGYGLNDRAIAAVRQWRFSPAQRRGAAVDVLVEVAVEFKLR